MQRTSGQIRRSDMSLGLLFQFSDYPSILPVVAIAAVAGGLLFLYGRRHRVRTSAMRKLADKRGLPWLYNTLPREFPRKLLDDQYTGWLIPRWSNPHNVIGGEDGPDYLLAFDINVQKGKGSYQRTIVARRSAIMKPKAAFEKGYIYRTFGDWQMVTRDSTQLTLPRIIEPYTVEKLWDLLR